MDVIYDIVLMGNKACVIFPIKNINENMYRCYVSWS